MNNAVYDANGLLGFRCFNCGHVKDRMWGTVCNSCRAETNRHSELIKEIKRLRKALAKKKGTP